jgi:DNA-binding XRE family transcriptional regulator
MSMMSITGRVYFHCGSVIQSTVILRSTDEARTFNPSIHPFMPNIATILKSEISRIARKEVRAETESIKKQSANYRNQLSALKKQVATLERLLRQTSRRTKAEPTTGINDEQASSGLRFRAKGFATHRKRLGLSAAQAGALMGVSGQTIYHWETGKAKPRASQMERIAALRKLSKKQAADVVDRVLGFKQ